MILKAKLIPLMLCVDPSGFGDDSDGEGPHDDGDLDPQAASQEFADYLVGLQIKGMINAKDVCSLAFYAKLANLTGIATELALKPSSPTRRFQRHLDKCLGLVDFVGEHAYTLKIPGTDRRAEARDVFDIPVVPPHEALAPLITPDSAPILATTPTPTPLPPPTTTR